MPNRIKKTPILFYVKDFELEIIKQRMQICGIRSGSAYLQKIAIDGYIIFLDHSCLKGYFRQIKMVGIIFNQTVCHLNPTGAFYQSDLESIK